MDFARSHVHQESVATKSKIRYIAPSPPPSDDKDVACENNKDPSNHPLDEMLIHAANQAAKDLLLGSVQNPDLQLVDSSLYPERMTPLSETIQPHQLVVIFESFDNLNFCYAERGAIFSNRNGHFHHDDFIGKPFGCKIRSRNNRGYGFVYLLKPTPELWARSLNHRTQIIHELDSSMMVYYLNLRPNMVVCEAGTGSGAMSHCILRTIAPAGMLHTYEFNPLRTETARKEFEKNGVGHLVTVYHKDVCGKDESCAGGFDLPAASVDAMVLDLPEPWLAIPHAAYCLKPNARIATYSPCVEQSQRTFLRMRQCGFHSMKTMEFRLREHYVDEVEYEMAPKEKRPRCSASSQFNGNTGGATSGGEDTGAEADNEKSEYETEGDQASLTTAGTFEDAAVAAGLLGEASSPLPGGGGGATPILLGALPTGVTSGISNNAAVAPSANGGGSGATSVKRKKVLVARPFVMMRGHTAFITFATAGNKPQPDPNKNLKSIA